jgi:hypothetical protein
LANAPQSPFHGRTSPESDVTLTTKPCVWARQRYNARLRPRNISDLIRYDY